LRMVRLWWLMGNIDMIVVPHLLDNLLTLIN
jgi:hypothetical protein